MVNLIAASDDALTTVTAFPRKTHVLDNVRIPLSDGVELSARIWLPVDADADPVPAVIEYIPFRYRDFTAPRDALIHPWFAGHGYASIRLELRGAGDSTGMPMDEYVAQEQLDGMEALAWIAKQPWCSGATGLFGMSWGAFNALQIAALRPPSLKAIIAVHGTDDRFADDVHFMGGCLLYNNLSWGAQYFAYMARPPDPTAFGPGWRDAWLNRIDAAPFVLDHWIGHQSKDAYWKHASISEDYAAVACPTYVVGGWADGYAAAAMRMAEHLACPKRVVVGPWAHTYPHIARPGPQIDWLTDATRWWDRWLKGIDTGIDEEDPIWLWMRDGAPPAPDYPRRGGRWLSFRDWPEQDDRRRYFLSRNALAVEQGPKEQASAKSVIAAGATGGEWLPHGVGPEMPLDQRLEDPGALVFDTFPLDRSLEICGAPVLTLGLSVDHPSGQIYARLSDVAPDGAATRVTHGLLNLAHRDGLDRPRPVTPGEAMSVTLRLVDVAQHIAPGHRLRLSIGTAAWPLAWPAPHPSRAALDLEACHIDLPTVDSSRESAAPFGPAAAPTSAPLTWARPVARSRVIARDAVTGRVTRTYDKDDGAYRLNDEGLSLDTTARQTYWIDNDDPASAGGRVAFTMDFKRVGWHAALTCEVTLTGGADAFHLAGELTARERDDMVRVRPIQRTIKRTFS